MATIQPAKAKHDREGRPIRGKGGRFLAATDNDRWRVRWRAPDGSSREKWCETFPEAEDYAASVEVDKRRGRYVDPGAGRITFKAWATSYLDDAPHKRASTLARDRAVTGKHLVPAIGTRPLASIRPLDVRHVVNTMAATLAPATVRTNYGVLRAILNAAVDAEIIAVSPCRGVRLPAADRRPIRFLSAEELEHLADETPDQYRPVVYLAGVLGLRWSEIAGLRVGRVDFLRRTVEVAETCAEVEGRVTFAEPKTAASRRTLRAPRFLVAILSEHLASRGRPGPDELVFVAPEGGPLRRSTFRSRVFLPAVGRAGITGLTFHGLRHTAAGLMIEAGAHVEAIKQRLGHSSIRVTSDVYGSLLPSVDESVTEALEARFASTGAGRCGVAVGLEAE